MHMHRHVTRQTAPSGSIPLHTTALTLHKQSAPSKGQLRRIKPPTLIGRATQTEHQKTAKDGRGKARLCRGQRAPQSSNSRGGFIDSNARRGRHTAREIFCFLGQGGEVLGLSSPYRNRRSRPKKRLMTSFGPKNVLSSGKAMSKKTGPPTPCFHRVGGIPLFWRVFVCLFRWCLCFSRQGPLFPTGSSRSFLF